MGKRKRDVQEMSKPDPRELELREQNLDELKFWIGFNFFEGIGPLRFKLLYDYFGSAQKAWRAGGEELRKIGLGERITSRFLFFREKFNPEQDISLEKLNCGWKILKIDWDKNWLQTILDEERRKDFAWVTKIKSYRLSDRSPIYVLSQKDKGYPEKLKKMDSSPPVIYIKSKILDFKSEKETVSFWQRPMIAAVGTRKMSTYGRQVAQILIGDMVRSGVTIVSGMARGMDTEAHRLTIERGGRTIAVLGCGVDVIYPSENQAIYQNIINNGAVVSELPLGFPPLPGNFPARNRIIAGLSEAILVLEAAEDSGSLITASCAAEQGKDVFAVPGPITSALSNGTAKLIKSGAKLVSSANDILEELNIDRSKIKDQRSKIREENLTEEEKSIWQCLENGEKLVDDIILETGMSADKAGSILSLMSIKGIVIELGGGKWGK